ncbi:MbtH family NRPS accessory protein [Mycobacterium sp. 663a-19]|uniref:MbtH family protein n=1 Tax=Mycobacterium sp. 663a-19 TaxID=2986148 RepID=UPI002D1F8006|nr:MbtH family protein [Mycobacterium sp. 663a-19]MEB3984207.1 MbtH family NRPS accessory protein [Mycobacterium sp. 663a-19]
MSIHPFDDGVTSILVLVEDKEQYNLWPDFASGVTLDHIEHIWTGIRPKSPGEGWPPGGFVEKPPGLGSEYGVG